MKVYILQLITGFQVGPTVIDVYDDMSKVFDAITLMISPRDFVKHHYDFKLTYHNDLSWTVQAVWHSNIYLLTQKEVK